MLLVIGLVLGIAIGWLLRGKPQTVATAPVEKEVQGVVVSTVQSDLLKPEWYAALGGKTNVRLAELIASTRIRVELINGALLNENALKNSGIAGFAKIDSHIVHLIV
ncbi:hypothetical protein [Deefgea rivuli]|uniref:hypothetical protein n=1 Tax=Deefgea rivuli TaxID=400948 RepID=UPI0006846F50|nr:hypothetical protein [Deefgea rivuli]